MVGLDQFITKNATLTNEKCDDAHPIKAMKFSVSPVVSEPVQNQSWTVVVADSHMDPLMPAAQTWM